MYTFARLISQKKKTLIQYNIYLHDVDNFQKKKTKIMPFTVLNI